MYLFDDDLDDFSASYSENTSTIHDFEQFKKDHPNYLESLNNRIKLLYNTYAALCGRSFSKIAENPESNETACRIGFGMLMRHALEVISIDVCLRSGIDVGGRSVYERLAALSGQIISGYDRATEVTLFKALNLTNEIAHPYVIDSCSSFETMCEFYGTSLKSVIEFYILCANKKKTKKYLLALKKQLDAFSIKNKLTYSLILGCLVRQLTECTVNLWCYNFSLLPTDVSTAEKQISLSATLTVLAQIAQGQRSTAFGSSALTNDVVRTLFKLKNASNNLMHVDPENVEIRSIKVHGKMMKALHPDVTEECSPYALGKKLNKATQDTPSLVTTLLCGFFGWFGVHHFYAGNIAKGIAFLLFGGFIIGPIISLKAIFSGSFTTKKWGTLAKTRLTSFLSVVFIILHIVLLFYLLFIKK